MLHVSGELNPAAGGVPVRPEINLEAALQPRQVMGTLAAAWTPSPLPQDRHRRSIYALKLRGLRDPFCEVFNEPNLDLSCERREASTIVPQVFSLFNGQATYDRAVALAVLVLREASEEAAVQAIYRRAFGRGATADEAAAAIAHWRRMTARHEKLTLAKTIRPLEVVREAVEENSGTKFTFREPLDEPFQIIEGKRDMAVQAAMTGLRLPCSRQLHEMDLLPVFQLVPSARKAQVRPLDRLQADRFPIEAMRCFHI
ncbi:MAG: hypothetical protein B7Z73_15860 [Planctomycetia bacterium 21-64-5]|nr:MAG: hypothetical protein B7Z73_15860 [Planctomycetia bacterium 21-64-5]